MGWMNPPNLSLDVANVDEGITSSRQLATNDTAGVSALRSEAGIVLCNG